MSSDQRALEARLLTILSEFEIIDAHEHLAPEADRLARDVDVFTLFAHYTRGDLAIAGMAQPEYDALFDQRIPLETRWASFAPYWKQIRFGSYARAALLAARQFYGIEDIDDQTYGPLSEAIKSANRPGLYEWVLGETCNIRLALAQCGRTDLGHPRLVPVMPLLFDLGSWQALAHPIFEPNALVRTLDDYLDTVRHYITRVQAEGAVGLKTFSNPYAQADRHAALEVFEDLRSGAVDSVPQRNPLGDYITDAAIAYAGERELVVCVHTGYWGDFRTLDPLHMIPVLQRHPDVRFDFYHLGYPWVRESLMLGKGFPNVWLNLCWTHIISQEFATSALDEAIDLIPMNKLLAFGGDYQVPVEKIYGHLYMAREDVARVLARRMLRGQLSESQAVDLAHRWFWDNPRDLYRLPV